MSGPGYDWNAYCFDCGVRAYKRKDLDGPNNMDIAVATWLKGQVVPPSSHQIESEVNFIRGWKSVATQSSPPLLKPSAPGAGKWKWATNVVEVSWDFGSTEFEGLPYEDALKASGLPKLVQLPKKLVEAWEASGRGVDGWNNDHLINDWLSEKHGFTHSGWKTRSDPSLWNDGRTRFALVNDHGTSYYAPHGEGFLCQAFTWADRADAEKATTVVSNHLGNGWRTIAVITDTFHRVVRIA